MSNSIFSVRVMTMKPDTKTFLTLLVAACLLIPCSMFALRPLPEMLKLPEIERKDVIGFALYTVHDNTLKLTAQLYPLEEGEDRVVRLEVEKDGTWVEIARTQVIDEGWTAPFRVEDWDDTQTLRYRVAHGPEARYVGTIRRNPVDKKEIVVAAFTGNSIRPNHGGDISRQDLVDNVKHVDADLLFFSGDQVYDHYHHYEAWMKFGRDFGEILRDRPTITIPDDHDVGQPNLWGEYGKISTLPGAADGGYSQSASYVKEVERAQTSHLPDPVHPLTIGQGIGVYFTRLNWGNVDFAILEDRKFKTGPAGRIPEQGPRPDHIQNPDYDPESIDLPGLKLLGDEQLAFLEDWSQDWEDARMKVALSATIFCAGAHIHGASGDRLHADLDSNGWPQTGRNKALAALRKAFAFHIAGDQHLATIFHHGIEEHRDAIWSFCVPSIANFYMRWWDPLEPGANREPGAPEYTGDTLDGFGNRITCYGAANPAMDPTRGGGALTTMAAGFGIVRFNTESREITMECWPRNVDLADPAAKPYPDWPCTIHQLDNFSPPSWQPLLTVSFDYPDPVIQLLDDASGEVLYTLRISGKEFTLRAPSSGRFSIRAGVDAPDRWITQGVSAGSIQKLNVKRQPECLNLEILENEYWWGGLSSRGHETPYTAESKVSYDLYGQNLGNQAQPLLLSSKGRFVWSEEPIQYTFDGGTIIVTTREGEILSGQKGNSLPEAYAYVSRTFFPSDGRIPDPLLFTAPQYNTWIELMYDQNEEDILAYAEAIIANGYPPGVLMIDDNWQEDYGTWEFSARRFKEPKKMMQQLHDMGFKVMLWVCPFVSADSMDFRYLAEEGMLILDPQKTQDILWANTKNKAAVVRWWNGASALLDLSNPKAMAWFKERLDYLVDEYNVDGFKFDAGDARFYTGGVVSFNPEATPNDHTMYFAELGLDYPLNEYRASWKMAGLPLAQRLRDKGHKWDDLVKLIPDQMSQSIMGYAYTCPDMIGGGEYRSFLQGATIDEELVVRSAQVHALMPMMQFSVAPWRVLSKENAAICLEMAKLHQRMGDTFLQLALEASRTGEPIVKPMAFAFPGKGYETIADQFVLGDDIIVAPVVKKGVRSRTVALPAGKWRAEDGTLHAGGGEVTIDVPLQRLPYFTRVE